MKFYNRDVVKNIIFPKLKAWLSNTFYTKGQVDQRISNAKVTAYVPSGTVNTIDDLPPLTAENVGRVFNLGQRGRTNGNFLEGADIQIYRGSEIGIVNAGTESDPLYMYNILGSLVDLSNYAEKILVENINKLIPNTATVNNKLATQADLSEAYDDTNIQERLTNIENLIRSSGEDDPEEPSTPSYLANLQNIKDVQNMIARIEENEQSSVAYEIGDYFIYNDKLYKVINDIDIGDTIVIEGNSPNIEEINITNELLKIIPLLEEKSKGLITWPTFKGYVIAGHNYVKGEVGEHATSEGSGTAGLGMDSHAEGFNTNAKGAAAHAEGNGTSAEGQAAHAEGNDTEATKNSSHAEGDGTQANGAAAHAEGRDTSATGESSHAEGRYSIANKRAAHAEGEYTLADGIASHAEGYYTQAKSDYQHVQGKYNELDNNNKYAHIVGWGTGTNASARKNIHTLETNGNAWFLGNVTIGNLKERLAKESVIAGEFDNTVSYQKNNLVFKDGFLYKFIVNHVGDWDSSHVELITIEQLLLNILKEEENLIENEPIEITYSDLVNLKENSELIPNQRYRIIDFVTTSIDKYNHCYSNWRSANHPFDLIVTALNINTLDNNAKAAQREGDTYFQNNNLSKWEIKYTLENSPSIENGKGVIYELKDEFNNICSYDFKNIQFERYKHNQSTFTISVAERQLSPINYYINNLPGYFGLKLSQDSTVNTVIYPHVFPEQFSSNFISSKYFYTFDIDGGTDFSLTGEVEKNNLINSTNIVFSNLNNIEGGRIYNNSIINSENITIDYFIENNEIENSSFIIINRESDYNKIYRGDYIFLGKSNKNNIIKNCKRDNLRRIINQDDLFVFLGEKNYFNTIVEAKGISIENNCWECECKTNSQLGNNYFLPYRNYITPSYITFHNYCNNIQCLNRVGLEFYSDDSNSSLDDVSASFITWTARTRPYRYEPTGSDIQMFEHDRSISTTIRDYHLDTSDYYEGKEGPLFTIILNNIKNLTSQTLGVTIHLGATIGVGQYSTGETTYLNLNIPISYAYIQPFGVYTFDALYFNWESLLYQENPYPLNDSYFFIDNHSSIFSHININFNYTTRIGMESSDGLYSILQTDQEEVYLIQETSY